MTDDETPRWQYRYENLIMSLATLEEGVERLNADQLDQLGRDGLIQRFEITFELAWKTLGDRLKGLGHKVKMSPAIVIREAFAADMIKEADMWMQAMNARNDTSHLDDAVRATSVVQQIAASFLPMFQEFVQGLKGNAA